MICAPSGEKYPSPAFTKPLVTWRMLERYFASTELLAGSSAAQIDVNRPAIPRMATATADNLVINDFLCSMGTQHISVRSIIPRKPTAYRLPLNAYCLLLHKPRLSQLIRREEVQQQLGDLLPAGVTGVR